MTRHVMSREEELNETDKDLQEQLTDEKPSRRERMHAEASVHGHKMTFADILKFAGLIAFFVVMILLCALIWPYVHEIFEPGGLDRVINDVRQAGPVGFHPSRHPVPPGRRRLHSRRGCSSRCRHDIRAVGRRAHRLGGLRRLQRVRVPAGPQARRAVRSGDGLREAHGQISHVRELGQAQHHRVRAFPHPGMPKDVFTYLVPLTHMPLRTFLLLSNIARIPASWCPPMPHRAWSRAISCRVSSSFLVAGAIAVVCILFYDKIMKAIERATGKSNLELRDYEKDED